jgi:hypothetical protein
MYEIAKSNKSHLLPAKIIEIKRMPINKQQTKIDILEQFIASGFHSTTDADNLTTHI